MSEHATESAADKAAQAEAAFVDSLAPDEDKWVPPNTPAEAPAAEEAAPAEEGTPAEEAQVAELPDSFTSQDVRGMLEAISDPAARAAAEAAYKNFQGDYTRSKQQLSEQAKALEGLDDLEKAKAAVEFYDGIQNDPEFAMEVHGYLSRVFEEAGMTPRDAAQAAAQEMVSPAEAAAPSPSFDEDPDAALKAKQEALEARLDQWEQQDEARRQEQREAELAAELLRQEMAIRSQDETLSDEDFDRIYDLAAARGGNLLEAHQQYKTMEQDFISRYIATKQTDVPPAEPQPGSAQPPPEIPRNEKGEPDLEQVHLIALQKLHNAMAGRE